MLKPKPPRKMQVPMHVRKDGHDKSVYLIILDYRVRIFNTPKGIGVKMSEHYPADKEFFPAHVTIGVSLQLVVDSATSACDPDGHPTTWFEGGHLEELADIYARAIR